MRSGVFKLWRFVAVILLAIIATSLVVFTVWWPSAGASTDNKLERPGAPVWKVKIDSTSLAQFPSPVIDNDLLYLIRIAQSAPYLSTLYALDAENGDQAWTRELRGVAQSVPVVKNGILYYLESVPSERDSVGAEVELVAVEAIHGMEISSVSVPGGSTLLAVLGDMAILYHTGTYFDDLTVRLTSTFRAIDTRSGEEQWRLELEGEHLFSGSQAVLASDGHIFMITNYVGVIDLQNGGRSDNIARVRSIDALSGEEEWSTDFGTLHIQDPPAMFENTIYISDSRFVRAISASDGDELWLFDHESARHKAGNGRFLPMSTQDAEGNVVLSGGPHQWMFGLHPKSGELLWSRDTIDAGGKPTAPPIVSTDLFYGSEGERYFPGYAPITGPSKFYLYSLDPRTGNEKWGIETPFGLHPRSQTASNTKRGAEQRVYYLGMEGYLYAISDPSRQEHIDLQNAETISLPEDDMDDEARETSEDDAALLEALMFKTRLADPELAPSERDEMRQSEDYELKYYRQLPDIYVALTYASAPTLWAKLSSLDIGEREVILESLSDEFDVTPEEISETVRRLRVWSEGVLADSVWAPN